MPTIERKTRENEKFHLLNFIQIARRDLRLSQRERKRWEKLVKKDLETLSKIRRRMHELKIPEPDYD